MKFLKRLVRKKQKVKVDLYPNTEEKPALTHKQLQRRKQMANSEIRKRLIEIQHLLRQSTISEAHPIQGLIANIQSAFNQQDVQEIENILYYALLHNKGHFNPKENYKQIYHNTLFQQVTKKLKPKTHAKKN